MRVTASGVLYGLVIVACCLESGCTPRLKIVELTASTLSAEVDEEVTIAWAYENDENLSQQTLLLRTVTVFGINEIIQGVPTNAREETFEFKGPVTVELVGTEQEGFSDHAAFDIGLAGDAFLHALIGSVSNSQFPRLGVFEANQVTEPDVIGARAGERFISFHQFAAFFDPVNNRNGDIDSLVKLLPSDQAFRAFSLSTEETDGFNLTEGSGYPFVSPFEPGLGLSDAMIFGGALAYNGEQIRVKGPGGKVFSIGVRRPNGIKFEPIFLTVSLRMNYALGSADLTEIQLGNLEQGLVTTLFAGATPDREFGSLDVEYDTDGTQEGEISGLVKLAIVGFGVAPINGEFFDTLVGIDSISWNLPFRFDNNLDADLNLQVPD